MILVKLSEQKCSLGCIGPLHHIQFDQLGMDCCEKNHEKWVGLEKWSMWGEIKASASVKNTGFDWLVEENWFSDGCKLLSLQESRFGCGQCCCWTRAPRVHKKGKHTLKVKSIWRPNWATFPVFEVVIKLLLIHYFYFRYFFEYPSWFT